MKSLSRVQLCIGSLALLLAVGPRAAIAQGDPDNRWPTTDRGNPGWYLSVTPYYWASNLDGALTLGFPEAEQQVSGFNIPVGDTVLEDSWAGRIEVGKGRVRGLFYFANAGLARPADFVNVVDPADTVSGNFDFKWTTMEFFGSVAIGPFTPSHSVEIYGGIRYQRWDQKITPTGQTGSSDFLETWIDPVIGGRAFVEVGRRWWAQFHADYGGFKVGSTATWELGGELGFRIVRFLDLSMRYNYMEVEFDNGKTGSESFIWENGVAQGWFFGAVIRP